MEQEFYKKKLLQIKSDILNRGGLKNREDLEISSDDLPDESDIAQSVSNQQVTFYMRQKEINKLKAIDVALQKIEENAYGCCEECEDPIGEKRLINQPWARLCISHAEEEEREESKFKKAM